MRLQKFLFIFVLAASSPLVLQAKPSPDPADGARNFVNGFYAWYVPAASAYTKGPAWSLAISKRRQDFDPGLAKMLAEDIAAQAASRDDIVGLDFDPFLSSQDPADKYEAGEAHLKKGQYWVAVLERSKGTLSAKPDLYAVVSQVKGHWVFTDFQYLEMGDLRSVLATLKKERK